MTSNVYHLRQFTNECMPHCHSGYVQQAFSHISFGCPKQSDCYFPPHLPQFQFLILCYDFHHRTSPLILPQTLESVGVPTSGHQLEASKCKTANKDIYHLVENPKSVSVM